jgi:hypothetical protein
MGEAVLSSRLARTRATKHEAAHAGTEAVAEDGRCCMCARCVITLITEDLADRRKSPVRSTEATYLLGSTAGVLEGGRAIRGPDVRWSASLNRHKVIYIAGVWGVQSGILCFVLGGLHSAVFKLSYSQRCPFIKKS